MNTQDKINEIHNELLNIANDFHKSHTTNLSDNEIDNLIRETHFALVDVLDKFDKKANELVQQNEQ